MLAPISIVFSLPCAFVSLHFYFLVGLLDFDMLFLALSTVFYVDSS